MRSHNTANLPVIFNLMCRRKDRVGDVTTQLRPTLSPDLSSGLAFVTREMIAYKKLRFFSLVHFSSGLES